MSLFPMTDSVHFDHLIEVVSTRLLPFAVTVFPSVLMLLCGGTLKPCKRLVPYQTLNSFIYLIISEWAHGFLFSSMDYNLLLSVFVLLPKSFQI